MLSPDFTLENKKAMQITHLHGLTILFVVWGEL